jgi:DNA mismatch endonuclease (patch repair protein)
VKGTKARPPIVGIAIHPGEIARVDRPTAARVVKITRAKEDPAERSRIMRAVKSRDTTPERRVAAVVRALGYRFSRKRALAGQPDFVLSKYRTVIFVHGCFWHGHDCRRGARVPKTNREYWLKKIARNRARDAVVRTALRRLGWRVLIIWECRLAREALIRRRIVAFLGKAEVT